MHSADQKFNTDSLKSETSIESVARLQTLKTIPKPEHLVMFDKNINNGLHRGLILIFDQQNFYKETLYREGSEKDRERIKEAAVTLGFDSSDIFAYHDLSYTNIKEEIYKWSQHSFKLYGCLMVFFMSHGDRNNQVMAKDRSFYIHELYDPFLTQCLSLVGKPKMFFVQACRGSKADKGQLEVLTDSVVEPALLPTHADLLLVQSSYEGFYSYRNRESGTWFIQTLCDELENSIQPKVEKVHLMDILSTVTRRIVQFTGHEGQKQCPTIHSTLTKKIYF